MAVAGIMLLTSSLPSSSSSSSSSVGQSAFSYNGAFSQQLSPFHHTLRKPKHPSFILLQRYKYSHALGFRNYPSTSTTCNAQKETPFELAVLKRWDVPWEWQTVSLTSLACGVSFVLTGLVGAVALPYLGIQVGELTFEEKAEVLLLNQGLATAAVLGVLYSLTSFQPLSDDVFRYDLRDPFSKQKGWLLWAGVGMAGALIGVGLAGVAMSFFSGENQQRETDSLALLLPLIGSSSISTACLVGITGILAPLLEETLFRGFLMVSLTKWVPTPVAVVISASVFALAHFTPSQFPQLFVLGTALGFSYAQTRNLLTPITIHAFWNTGVILLLTILKLQGYDIRELLQASQ